MITMHSLPGAARAITARAYLRLQVLLSLCVMSYYAAYPSAF